MLAAGWNAHTLNAPGKFLIAAAEHDTPRRARAYLVTDQAVADTASIYADLRPPLDEVSRQAIEQHGPEGRPGTSADDPIAPSVPPAEGGNRLDRTGETPEAILWAALSLAPDDGTTVPDLMEATGMSRPWVYLRLRELAELGQVVQVSRGCWRAVFDDAS
jgi:S-DNA-T family DNA segregation ATPase FtsK/SpoIIIE